MCVCTYRFRCGHSQTKIANDCQPQCDRSSYHQRLPLMCENCTFLNHWDFAIQHRSLMHQHLQESRATLILHWETCGYSMHDVERFIRPIKQRYLQQKNLDFRNRMVRQSASSLTKIRRGLARVCYVHGYLHRATQAKHLQRADANVLSEAERRLKMRPSPDVRVKLGKAIIKKKSRQQHSADWRIYVIEPADGEPAMIRTPSGDSPHPLRSNPIR